MIYCFCCILQTEASYRFYLQSRREDYKKSLGIEGCLRTLHNSVSMTTFGICFLATTTEPLPAPRYFPVLIHDAQCILNVIMAYHPPTLEVNPFQSAMFYHPTAISPTSLASLDTSLAHDKWQQLVFKWTFFRNSSACQ